MYPEPPYLPAADKMNSNKERELAAAFTTKPGPGILNYALGRVRITQEQDAHLAQDNSNNEHLPNQFLNMRNLSHKPHFKYRMVMDANLVFQKPYAGWKSRTTPAMVPDGLSNTAVLAEKHLAATELGFSTDSGYPVRSRELQDAFAALGANLGGGKDNFGNDQIQLGGNAGARIGLAETAFMTRGIAFGPGDTRNYPGNMGDQTAWRHLVDPNGPTIGSWHPGNQVNVLMADGSVRSIGSDIDQMYMLPLLGAPDDTDTRTDGRVLTLP